MTKTLFDIGHDLHALAALLDEMDGEIGPEADVAVQAWLAEIATNEAVKLENYRKLILQFETEAAVARAEEDQYRKMRETRERTIDWLKARIKDYLDFTGVTKAKTATGRAFCIEKNGGKLSIEWAPEVEQDPEKAGVFCKLVPTLDKEAVRESLEAGEELPFARFRPRGTHLKIR